MPVSDRISDNTIAIVGGGLAGLISAIMLNRYGFNVTVIEKKHYPFHRVCGEYISNEVQPFFKTLGIHLDEYQPSSINKLAISSVSGKLFKTDLDLGGFGLSRFQLDKHLYLQAEKEGVTFALGVKVNEIDFTADKFLLSLSDNSTLTASIAIAAYGKRSNLDKSRDFFYRRSPYMGVKYHIKTDFPTNVVQLDNFPGGYCGIVKIEDDKYNLCYFSTNRNLREAGSLEEMERQFLFKNPFLKSYFSNSEFLTTKPEVINEISFERKSLVEDHLLFCGDAAGMISPLCGNGMAMAVHSAKILADVIKDSRNAGRNHLEKVYISTWRRQFSSRLMVGRMAQKLFGSRKISEMAVASLSGFPSFSKFIIKKTHGEPF